VAEAVEAVAPLPVVVRAHTAAPQRLGRLRRHMVAVAAQAAVAQVRAIRHQCQVERMVRRQMSRLAQVRGMTRAGSSRTSARKRSVSASTQTLRCAWRRAKGSATQLEIAASADRMALFNFSWVAASGTHSKDKLVLIHAILKMKEQRLLLRCKKQREAVGVHGTVQTVLASDVGKVFLVCNRRAGRVVRPCQAE